MILASNSFLEMCSDFCCNCLEDGRMLHLWTDSVHGEFDIISSYFDPGDAAQQCKSMRTMRHNVRKYAHTVLLGDFNFVMSPLDRVHDSLQLDDITLCNKRQAKLWNELFGTFLEFEQPLYTCKYANGNSKIDRVYDSLSPLELATVGTSINLLEAPVHTSDHTPISCRFFLLARCGRSLPPWVASNKMYKESLEAYLNEKLIDPSLAVEDLVLQVQEDPMRSLTEIALHAVAKGL